MNSILRFPNLLLIAILLFSSIHSISQNLISIELESFKEMEKVELVDLFYPSDPFAEPSGNQKILNDVQYIRVHQNVQNEIINSKPLLLGLSFEHEGQTIPLELYQTNLFSENYSVKTSDGQKLEQRDNHVFYKGIIKSQPNSLVSASFFEDKIVICISNQNGNLRISQYEGNLYSMYFDHDFKVKKNFTCNTEDWNYKPDQDKLLQPSQKSMTGNCVDIYFETDLATYNEQGANIIQTENYILTIFNEVQTLYDNEGIPIALSEIFIWTTSDPYSGTNSAGTILDIFADEVVNSYNGRLAHFVTTRNIGGGIAWLDVLCDNYSSNCGGGVSCGPYAVSGNLTTSTASYPNYSWNVNVVAHELGHNFGSPHTHACAWNGNFTQIDDCGNLGGSASCYDSSDPILPPSGTIMSYCHNVGGVGINFALGFGDQPGALILNEFLSAPCPTGNCDVTGCTSASACNYNQLANIDDGSCVFPDGCNDSLACNYDPSALCDDGSCEYPGCNNPFACNYDFQSGCDDGSCILKGCTNSSACNYEPTATCTDTKCVFNIDACTGVCSDFSGNGTDFLSYYPVNSWSFSTGSGDGYYYHNIATLTVVGNNNSFNNQTTLMTNTVFEDGDFTFDWNYLAQDHAANDPAIYTINGVPIEITNPADPNDQSGTLTFFANAGDVIGFGVQSTDGDNQAGVLIISELLYPLQTCGCTDPCASNYDSDFDFIDNNCQYFMGCTDTSACNFDSFAVLDDGSCIYTTNCFGSCVNEFEEGISYTGFFGPSFWNQNLNGGNGAISHTIGTLAILANDDISPISTEISITAFLGGDISFDWCYYNPDGTNVDLGFYSVNGNVGTLNNLGSNYQTGSGSFTITSGDNVTFGLISNSASDGVGILTITNFTYGLPTCGCTDSTACNYDPNAGSNDGSCLFPGCTDSNACNYDSTAGCDDGSCASGSNGCTNPLACNYDSTACADDGSCILPDGCTNNVACNYDSTALCDNGSCILPDGCTNNTACNYNSTALCDDGSCILPDGCTNNLACNYISTALCDDSSCILPDGCIDPQACNYDSTALCDDGSCILPDGCTNNLACNYDSTALCDDSSCILPDGCIDPQACNYDSTALCDNGSCILPDGCTNNLACNYDSTAQCDDGSCILPDGCIDPQACNYDSTALCDDGSCILPDGCIDLQACNYDSTALCDDGSCILPDGCLDSQACNYDSTALCDDGSCILPDGCIDPQACNYDSTALCDDGSCILPDGCIDPLACNYDSTALCDDGSCILPDGCTDNTACNYDSTALCDDGSCILPDGCTNNSACNYDSIALCDDGSCILPDGCTNNTACNYDSTALCDDGSCILPDGCTDNTACNYDSTALCDDGSCIPGPCGNCIGDANNDGLVNILDLIAVSSNFGCTSSCLEGDANFDGVVDILDLVAVSSNFGVDCP